MFADLLKSFFYVKRI